MEQVASKRLLEYYNSFSKVSMNKVCTIVENRPDDLNDDKKLKEPEHFIYAYNNTNNYWYYKHVENN